MEFYKSAGAERFKRNPILILIWMTWLIVSLGYLAAMDGFSTIVGITVSTLVASFIHMLISYVIDIRDCLVQSTYKKIDLDQ